MFEGTLPQTQNQKVYIVCLNPHCLKSDQRCLSTKSLHSHPSQCSKFYYPADQITSKHWTQLDKYPMDSLGMAAKKKYQASRENNFLSGALSAMRNKLMQQLQELQQKLCDLYPSRDFQRCYSNVYGLAKVAENIKLERSPGYISNLINTNLSAQNYHLLLRLNQSYDQMKNVIDSLANKLLSSFNSVLGKKNTPQPMTVKQHTARKINYGIFKSKFVASLKIQINQTVVNFPKLSHIASFLPWVYTQKLFTEGTHHFKLSSIRYPIVQNAGFTILPEHDIDTYPYSCFKSLFSRDGKGFKLIKGEQIDQIVAQTTVVTLRLELGPQPRALLFDSELSCQYECLLEEKRAYRMGVYGCGWAMDIIELN